MQYKTPLHLVQNFSYLMLIFCFKWNAVNIQSTSICACKSGFVGSKQCLLRMLVETQRILFLIWISCQSLTYEIYNSCYTSSFRIIVTFLIPFMWWFQLFVKVSRIPRLSTLWTSLAAAWQEKGLTPSLRLSRLVRGCHQNFVKTASVLILIKS